MPAPVHGELPALACDCQFHLFDHEHRYPLSSSGGQVVPDANVQALLNTHREVGIERGVIVHAVCYGPDHSLMIDALAIAGPSYRGCATASVLYEAGDANVQKLHDAGVRGVRVNFHKKIQLERTEADVPRVIARARELGWYIKVQPDNGVGLHNEGVLENLAAFDKVEEIPVLIDHFARARVADGPHGPIARKVVRSLRERPNIWVMLSNAYKLLRGDESWEDTIPIARAYIDAAPDRIVWGSDWPHLLSDVPPPNVASLLDVLRAQCASDEELEKIIVRNPARMFGFL